MLKKDVILNYSKCRTFECYLKCPLISFTNYWHVPTHRSVFPESSFDN